MPNILFDENDSDEDVSFKKSEYAKKYDTLRRKEELLKLKNKYGEREVNFSDSSSSEDDDEEPEFTEAFERDFFKTLSCLKNKDPKIYNKDVKFFNAEDEVLKEKKEKYKPIKIRDYNRELILNEHKSDDEEEYQEKPPASPTYVQEQNEIKNMFKKVINDDNEELNEDIGGLFVKKKKTKAEEEEEENSYREWLKGQSKHLVDDTIESELKPLKDYWSNPLLDKDEAFLRDYVLNQGFKDPNDVKKIPSYDEIVNQEEDDVSEDEKLVNKQVEFEHKFNFRFEEPDQEFIKQYPRTLEHTLRQKSDKRSQKRAEIKQRKAEEKLKKKEEISRMKAMKLKEIQEKISKIKEITGNDELAFNPEDIEGDFDPEEHDRRMHEIFDQEYYEHNVDSKKPTFPELDEELGIENWENWGQEDEVENGDDEPHCEDDNFNMDCEYDPKTAKKTLFDDIKDTIEGKNKRKRKRKGKFSEALEKEKPLFDPVKLNKTLSQYVDEYYKLDCEDVIGDLPCRFKYREVPACDYGLSIEEILLADDKELNRWYPLKKTLQHRPEHLQKNDQKIFEKKARDISLKQKILPSLFKPQEEEEVESTNVETVTKKKKKKNKKKRKNSDNLDVTIDDNNIDNKSDKNKVKELQSDTINETNELSDIKMNKKRKRDSESSIKETIEPVKTENEVVPVKTKRKRRGKGKKSVENNDSVENGNVNKKNDDVSENIVDKTNSKKRRKKKNKNESNENDASKDISQRDEKDKKLHKIKSKGIKKHKSSNNSENGIVSNLSDERLKAFGLNPKKYRSFMKFKKH